MSLRVSALSPPRSQLSLEVFNVSDSVWMFLQALLLAVFDLILNLIETFVKFINRKWKKKSNKLPLNPSKWWILRLNIDRVNRRSKLNRTTPKTCLDKYGNRLIFLLITVDNTNFLLSLAKFYLFKKEKIQFFSDESLMDSSIFFIEQGRQEAEYIYISNRSQNQQSHNKSLNWYHDRRVL